MTISEAAAHAHAREPRAPQGDQHPVPRPTTNGRVTVMAGGMSPHYVQRFLDRANLSTTSRYLTIDQQGMHNALKAFERARGEDTPTDTQSADAETTSGTNDAQKLLQ